MNLETVRLEVADYIATVTIDRPPVNAQNQKAREELIRVFDAISDRDDVRVAILTAAGKVFSAGALPRAPERSAMPLMARIISFAVSRSTGARRRITSFSTST